MKIGVLLSSQINISSPFHHMTQYYLTISFYTNQKKYKRQIGWGRNCTGAPKCYSKKNINKLLWYQVEQLTES